MEVVIVGFPTLGLLFQTADGITPGAAIDELSPVVTNSDFIVIYANINASDTIGTSVPVYYDLFLYQVEVVYNETLVLSEIYGIDIDINNTEYQYEPSSSSSSSSGLPVLESSSSSTWATSSASLFGSSSSSTGSFAFSSMDSSSFPLDSSSSSSLSEWSSSSSSSFASSGSSSHSASSLPSSLSSSTTASEGSSSSQSSSSSSSLSSLSSSSLLSLWSSSSSYSGSSTSSTSDSSPALLSSSSSSSSSMPSSSTATSSSSPLSDSLASSALSSSPTASFGSSSSQTSSSSSVSDAGTSSSSSSWPSSTSSAVVTTSSSSPSSSSSVAESSSASSSSSSIAPVPTSFSSSSASGLTSSSVSSLMSSSSALQSSSPTSASSSLTSSPASSSSSTLWSSLSSSSSASPSSPTSSSITSSTALPISASSSSSVSDLSSSTSEPSSSSSVAESSSASSSSSSIAPVPTSFSSSSASGLTSSSVSSLMSSSSALQSSSPTSASTSLTSSPASSSSSTLSSSLPSMSSSSASSSALVSSGISSSSASPSSPTSSSVTSSTALPISASSSSSSSDLSSSTSESSSSSSSLQTAVTSSTTPSSSSSSSSSPSASSSSSPTASSTAVTDSSSSSVTAVSSSPLSSSSSSFSSPGLATATSSSVSSSVLSSTSSDFSSATPVSTSAASSLLSASSSLSSSPSTETSTLPSSSSSSFSSTALSVLASSSLTSSSLLSSSWPTSTSQPSSSSALSASALTSSSGSSSPWSSSASTAGQLLTSSQIASSISSSPAPLLSSSSSSAVTSSWSFASSASSSPSSSSAWLSSSSSAATSQSSPAPASPFTSASSGSGSSSSSAAFSSTGYDVGCAPSPSCYTELPASCGLPFFQRAGEHLALLLPFTEGESDAAALTASDFSCNHLGAMTRGADSSFWLVSESGLGLSGSGQDSRLVSDFSMQDVQNSAQGGAAGIDGYSIELWLQPASLQQTEAVFFIGAVYAAGSQQDDDSQLNVGDSLLLLQDGSEFSFVLQVPAVGITDYVITVDSPTSAQLQPYHDAVTHAFTPFSTAAPTLTQLVLVLNSSEASMAVYVNGQLAVTPVTGWDGDLSGWFTAGSLLSFAQTSSNASGDTWAGEIRLLAVYTTALSADSVYSNWNASLPSPVPQPVSNHNVSWSLLQPSFTVNFSSSPVLISITQLPWTGVLSVYNATDNVTTVLLPSALPLHFNATISLTFTYAPPADYNASYVVNITYTIASPFAPAVPSNAGRIFLYVPQVITPPLPINSTVNVTAHVAALIQLTGIDEDSSTARANMTAAFIASLPAYGQLFQCDDSGGQGEAIVSMTGQGAQYADGLQLVAVTDSELRVWYLPAAGSLSFSESAIVNPEDSFTFRVLTKATLSACSGWVSLISHNNLQAFPAQLLLTGNEPVLVSLQAVDAVSEAFAYALVRAPERGVLQDALNVSIALLTSFTLPVYYATSQDRYSGLYDRDAAPLPDAFSFAALSPGGLLSVPAEVSISFAPTLGPPLLELIAPVAGFDVVVSTVANFSAVINASGLADANSTSWLCTLTVLPASATVTVGDAASFSLQAAVDTILDLPDSVQFTAITADANLLLSELTFSSAYAGSFTVNLTVANAADSRISSSAAMTLTAVPASADGTNTDSGAAAILPFNAVWLWITVGVLVAIVIIVVVMRRQCGNKDREPALTNEEKHILTKAKQGARLDTGVSRAAGEDAAAVSALAGETRAAGASEEKKRGGWLEQASFGGLDSKAERESMPQHEELQCTLSVLPIVRGLETSHLGSRVDTELWQQFASSASLLPPAERIMMGTATLSAFEQLPIVSEDYTATPVLPLSMTAGRSSLDGSETVESGPVQSLSDTAGSGSHLAAINTGGLDSGRGDRPARLFLSTHSVVDGAVVSPCQSQSQTPRPSISSAHSGLHRSLSSIFFLPSAAGLLASPRTGAMPAIFAPSPLHGSAASTELRASTYALDSAASPTGRGRASHAALAAGDIVPVNPMIPLNVPSPRYPVDVYNKRTRTRSSINLNARSLRPTSSAQAAEAEAAELYAAMARQHPLFQQPQ